ncbi:MAG: signal peptidase I [Oscillospiraceae bacterium]|nr:signal peptidase I [Oscillospiraceae bacterium]
MKSSRLALILVVLGLLVSVQSVLFFLPGRLLELYYQVRVLAYVILPIVFLIFMGKDGHPVPKGKQSSLLGGLFAICHLGILLITALLFGAGKNVMLPGFSVIPSYIWIYAIPILALETLRLKIIRACPRGTRDLIAVLSTLVFTYIHLDVLRGAFPIAYEDVLPLFFSSVFPAFILNALLVYMAYEGSLRSLVFVRAAWSLPPIFSPVLPDVPMVAYGIISTGCVIVAAIVYSANMTDRTGKSAQRKKRQERYQAQSVSIYAVAAVVITLTITFFLRLFPIFPSVVLTSSMKGENGFDRGSIVLIKKIPQDKIFDGIKQGDVIHFEKDGAEIVHRVIDFRYNQSGGRVYITQGDANDKADPAPVEASQVSGITQSYIPFIGWPALIARAILGQ